MQVISVKQTSGTENWLQRRGAVVCLAPRHVAATFATFGFTRKSLPRVPPGGGPPFGSTSGAWAARSARWDRGESAGVVGGRLLGRKRERRSDNESDRWWEHVLYRFIRPLDQIQLGSQRSTFKTGSML